MKVKRGESDQGMSCRWEDRPGHTGEGNELIAGWRFKVRGKSLGTSGGQEENEH